MINLGLSQSRPKNLTFGQGDVLLRLANNIHRLHPKGRRPAAEAEAVAEAVEMILAREREGRATANRVRVGYPHFPYAVQLRIDTFYFLIFILFYLFYKSKY